MPPRRCKTLGVYYQHSTHRLPEPGSKERICHGSLYDPRRSPHQIQFTKKRRITHGKRKIHEPRQLLGSPRRQQAAILPTPIQEKKFNPRQKNSE
ncbi:hypothetical protein NPIL_298531 [Nephila pilipes]|uniref:Uncharacterized protein n=1 Tax=Nephila pilipes TaxID=299642 RepID=A0A8X6MR21_NEPPI|nr:hypothetical protein NPIL_298531 [Nephila pilipes]